STVSVLLGNGDGTFRASPTFAAGENPSSVAMGDLNGDGRPDLAVANSDPSDVSVLLGNGDGTFQTAQAFAAGDHPISVAVGDVNGDGRPDLAVANDLSIEEGGFPVQGTVSVLLGNGDGTFQTAQAFAADNGPDSVAIVDFNGDGLPDLAVANFRSGTVSVLLGNGDGTFQSAQTFAAGNEPRSVADGDVNGDGRLDLAVANSGSNSVVVLLGNGDGTFQAAQTFGVGRSPTSVAVGDINGDGRPDLAVANVSSRNVSVLINNTAVAPTTFTLTVTKTGTGSGTVTSSPPGIDCGPTCSAAYDSGTVVTLTATPAAGSFISGSSGCDVVSETSCTVTMNAARTVTAIFTRERLTLTVNKTGIGSGTVTSSPPGINCGATCSASYDDGTVV